MTAHIQKLPSQYKEKLINELTAELSSPEAKTNHKYERRIRIVLQYYKGAPLDTLIAEGARRSSILLWSKIAREQGVKALDDKKRPGAKPKLSDEQCQILASAIESDPLDYGYNVWKGSTISDFILKKFGITLSVSQSINVIKNRCNMTYTRAHMFPAKGKDNEAEQEAFKKKLLS